MYSYLFTLCIVLISNICLKKHSISRMSEFIFVQVACCPLVVQVNWTHAQHFQMYFSVFGLGFCLLPSACWDSFLYLTRYTSKKVIETTLYIL